MAQKLRERGYRNVYALQGGFDAWRDKGFPLERRAAAEKSTYVSG